MAKRATGRRILGKRCMVFRDCGIGLGGEMREQKGERSNQDGTSKGRIVSGERLRKLRQRTPAREG